MPTRPTDRGDSFPSTRWSRILERDGPRDLEALARAYARPIHAWLAARLRLDAEAARDLAQEAFAWMLESRLLDRADPGRGRFRGFLKRALANFALEQLRKQGAVKRGGGRVQEPLDAAAAIADPRAPTPDHVLDEAWRRELLERAQQQLEEELVAGGRHTHYLLFRDFFLDDAEGDDVDHATLAERYAITRTDVSNRLAYAKRRYRELLRALMQETVGDEETLQEELRWLFGTDGAAGSGRP